MNNVETGSLKARALRRPSAADKSRGNSTSPHHSDTLDPSPSSPSSSSSPLAGAAFFAGANAYVTPPMAAAKTKAASSPSIYDASARLFKWWSNPPFRTDKQDELITMKSSVLPPPLSEQASMSSSNDQIGLNFSDHKPILIDGPLSVSTAALLAKGGRGDGHGSEVPPSSPLKPVAHIPTPNAPIANDFYSILFGVLVWKWTSYGGTLWIHKLLYSSVTYAPLLLNSLEMIVCTVLSYAALHARPLKLGPRRPLTSRTQVLNLATIVVLAVFHAVAHRLAQLHLPANSLPANSFTFRENQLLIVAITLATFTMRLEPTATYLPLIPVVVAEVADSLLHITNRPGLFSTSVLLSSCNALRMTLVWHVMTTDTEPKLSPTNVLFYTAPLEAALLLPTSIFLEPNVKETWAYFHNVEFAVLLVGVMVLGFSMRLANKYLLRMLNPLSLTVLSEGQLVLYSLVSLAFGWAELTLIRLSGMVMKMVCCVLYARARIS